jgi:hypothetical protein
MVNAVFTGVMTRSGDQATTVNAVPSGPAGAQNRIIGARKRALPTQLRCARNRRSVRIHSRSDVQ